MKKYIIKYANGSTCPDIKDEFNSREEAGDFLMRYIRIHNEFLHIGDNNYLLPFDFTLEEVDIKNVNEVITDYASAVKAIKKKTYFHNNRIACNFKHTDALSALNKLFTIAQAWNKEDGFVPDFSNWEQDKWFPWFKYSKDAAEFVCADTINAATAASAHLGSRLCFKTSERAAQFGKQFEVLYNKVFL